MSAILLLVLPFVGAILSFLAGKREKAYAFYVAQAVGIMLFGLTLFLFVTYTNPIDISIKWFTFGSFSLPFGIYIDHLSLVMLLIATGLGALDIHFSHDYMKGEKDQSRYYAKILFFIGGMILLVSAKELLGLFVGWEFMGLASYLLISFWHQNKAPADAGVYAFLYTKFGDIFLFAAVGILFYATGTLDLQQLNHLAKSGEISDSITFVAALFIFIAAIGKSGQFPLFPWLMRAMEGPTTVSALIHGATMVNSGIYIVARLFDFYIASETLIIVATVASLSAFIGATSALVQTEIKKVLAYSTMSHLSLAFIGLGAGSLAAGMGHLTNHAVFKALLFLSAGAVIMATHHTKDLFKLGGLGGKLRLVALMMAIGGLSLSGIPPLSGFYSKDAVIASVLINPQTYGVISTLTVIAGVLSIAYILRVWILIFAGKPKEDAIYQKTTAPSIFWIILPLSIMAILTIVLACYQEELAVYITNEAYHEPHISYLPIYLLGMIAFLGWGVYRLYYKRVDLKEKLVAQPLFKSIHGVLLNGYYIESMIGWFVKNFILEAVAKAIAWFDYAVIDASINAFVPIARFFFRGVGATHSSKPSNQAGVMMLGLFLLLAMILIGSLV